jgi:hypothetical protein
MEGLVRRRPGTVSSVAVKMANSSLLQRASWSPAAAKAADSTPYQEALWEASLWSL